MYCRGCSEPIPEDSRYCCYCGCVQEAEAVWEELRGRFLSRLDELGKPMGAGVGLAQATEELMQAARQSAETGAGADDIADLCGQVFAGMVADDLKALLRR